MSFCCAAENQFGPKVAERDLRRYRRRVADTVTKLILAQLRHWPLLNKRLLNIGGGIGVISAELAADGIASATLVEASPAYLEVAPEGAAVPLRFAIHAISSRRLRTDSRYVAGCGRHNAGSRRLLLPGC
jgi:hypothetical protein